MGATFEDRAVVGTDYTPAFLLLLTVRFRALDLGYPGLHLSTHLQPVYTLYGLL